MTAILFDTLEFANQLKIRIEVQLIEMKRDLKEMDTALRHEIELLRSETKRDIAETKAELIRWVVGAGLLQTSLIIGALMKMAHLI